MDLSKLKMNTIKLTTMTAAVAMLALGATQAVADGVNGGAAAGTASVDVVNTVTVTETTPINFGEMVIITDGQGGTVDTVMSPATIFTWPGVAAQAKPWIPAGGAANIFTNTKARAFPTGGGLPATAGVYTITGMALGSSMGLLVDGLQLGDPLAVTNMACVGCISVVQPAMTVNTFTATVGAGDTLAGSIITDANGVGGDGSVTINLGATLSVANTVNDSNLGGTAVPVVGALEDGHYQGVVNVAAIY